MKSVYLPNEKQKIKRQIRTLMKNQRFLNTPLGIYKMDYLLNELEKIEILLQIQKEQRRRYKWH